MIITDPVILWVVVGAASGAVLGIAGTGGGVISIPVLMIFGGYDVKEASGYGLLALTAGAAVSWLIQRKNTVYPLTAVLILFAGLVAFLTVPLKQISPPWLIILILNITFVFSLYSLWILRKPGDPGENKPFSYQVKTATIGGMLTGFLSTMTGLGGGVLIIPWLTGITRLAFEQAMACSLLTVAATAPFSAWRQGRFDLALPEWGGLIAGIVVMGLLVNKMTSYIKRDQMIVVRKITMTGVILISMARTLTEVFN
jgi:uncharacterized membrane protein YfcA